MAQGSLIRRGIRRKRMLGYIRIETNSGGLRRYFFGVIFIEDGIRSLFFIHIGLVFIKCVARHLVGRCIGRLRLPKFPLRIRMGTSFGPERGASGSDHGLRSRQPIRKGSRRILGTGLPRRPGTTPLTGRGSLIDCRLRFSPETDFLHKSHSAHSWLLIKVNPGFTFSRLITPAVNAKLQEASIGNEKCGSALEGTSRLGRK